MKIFNLTCAANSAKLPSLFLIDEGTCCELPVFPVDFFGGASVAGSLAGAEWFGFMAATIEDEMESYWGRE